MAVARHARVQQPPAARLRLCCYVCSSQGHAVGQHSARKAVAALMCSEHCS